MTDSIKLLIEIPEFYRKINFYSYLEGVLKKNLTQLEFISLNTLRDEAILTDLAIFSYGKYQIKLNANTRFMNECIDKIIENYFYGLGYEKSQAEYRDIGGMGYYNYSRVVFKNKNQEGYDLRISRIPLTSTPVKKGDETDKKYHNIFNLSIEGIQLDEK